jgi:excisionase family DNA binding protein
MPDEAAAVEISPRPGAAQQLWTLDEAARITNTSRTTIQRAIRAGELRSVHIGRKHLIRDDDLAAYINALPSA